MGMTDDEMFYTQTMAEIHSEQGNLTQAAEIYARLQEKEPDNQELIDALADLEGKRIQRKIDEITPLFEAWVRLSLRFRQSGVVQ